MDKPTYLVGFSGPPSSGKDTLGYGLARFLNNKGIPVETLALSMPMRLSVYGLLGLEYSQSHYDAFKDMPIELDGGRTTTIRQEMIALSETHVKPRLGHGWWARALLNRRTIRTAGVLVVTDMGFDSEHDVFTETFGAAHCAWIHVHRDGCDFSKDSRSYIGKGCHIHNNGDAETEVQRIYGRLMNQYHWDLDRL